MCLQLSKRQCATHQAHKTDSLWSSETKLFASTSLKTQVQIPRSHVILGMLVHVCNSSTPTERWEAETGESPEVCEACEGQLAWHMQEQTTKKPCLSDVGSETPESVLWPPHVSDADAVLPNIKPSTVSL